MVQATLFGEVELLRMSIRVALQVNFYFVIDALF